MWTALRLYTTTRPPPSPNLICKFHFAVIKSLRSATLCCRRSTNSFTINLSRRSNRDNQQIVFYLNPEFYSQSNFNCSSSTNKLVPLLATPTVMTYTNFKKFLYYHIYKGKELKIVIHNEYSPSILQYSYSTNLFFDDTAYIIYLHVIFVLKK